MLVPLAGVLFKTATLGLDGIWQQLATPRVWAALRLSFGTAFLAAAINAVFGLLVAWVFVRYEFPGKRLFDGFTKDIELRIVEVVQSPFVSHVRYAVEK